MHTPFYLLLREAAAANVTAELSNLSNSTSSTGNSTETARERWEKEWFPKIGWTVAGILATIAVTIAAGAIYSKKHKRRNAPVAERRPSNDGEGPGPGNPEEGEELRTLGSDRRRINPE